LLIICFSILNGPATPMIYTLSLHDALPILANYANDNVGSGVGSIIKTQAELMSARAGGLGKPGYTVRVGADGKYYAPSDIEGAKDRKSTRLNSSHVKISYAVFCLKKKIKMT